jgi:hypothetical protein
MGGIFDWLQRRKAEFERLRPSLPGEPGPMLPALPAPRGPAGLPAPIQPPRPSMFEIMRPREEPGALKPFLAPPQMFLRFAPPELPAPAPPPEEAQRELWMTLFPEGEEEEPTMLQRFAALAPEVPEVPQAGMPYEIRFPAGEPVPLWAVTTEWTMPSQWDLVHRIQEWDLPAMWRTVYVETDYPDWRRQSTEATHGRVPAPAYDIDLLAGPGDPDDRLSLFLGVPSGVWNAYFRDVRNEYEAREAGEAYFREVLSPLLHRFTNAMDLLKPAYLRGWFEINPVASRPGWPPYWWLQYRESGPR